MPDATPRTSPRDAILPPEIRLDSTARIRLTGAWDIRALETLASGLQRRLAALPRGNAEWDLSGIQRMDHIGALILWRAWNRARPAQALIRPEHESFFATLAA